MQCFVIDVPKHDYEVQDLKQSQSKVQLSFRSSRKCNNNRAIDDSEV